MSNGIVGTPVESCEKCRFFRVENEDYLHHYIDESGTSCMKRVFSRSACGCRRFPKYEDRNADDWCGEFKAKE